MQQPTRKIKRPGKFVLPLLASTSTLLSLSVTWKDMLPSHNTAASIVNACSCSSLKIQTTSKASLWIEKQKKGQPYNCRKQQEKEKNVCWPVEWDVKTITWLTVSIRNCWASLTPSSVKQSL